MGKATRKKDFDLARDEERNRKRNMVKILRQTIERLKKRFEKEEKEMGDNREQAESRGAESRFWHNVFHALIEEGVLANTRAIQRRAWQRLAHEE
eukprot:scaffold367066_cov36-Prasinocladus_malaysianus.AAC.1